MTSSKRLETLTKNRSSLDHKTTHLYFISLAPDSYVQSQPPGEQRRSEQRNGVPNENSQSLLLGVPLGRCQRKNRGKKRKEADAKGSKTIVRTQTNVPNKTPAREAVRPERRARGKRPRGEIALERAECVSVCLSVRARVRVRLGTGVETVSLPLREPLGSG